MTEVFSRDTGHQGGISLTQYDDKSCALEIDRGRSSYAAVSPDVLHALADWIIANVPKPEPTPLPTKFAAVVKSDGELYSVGDTENEPKWVKANTEGGEWVQSELLRDQGFEVIYEGVDA